MPQMFLLNPWRYLVFEYLRQNSVPDAKVLHTANVLAEYLDNDENGTVDQPEVLAKLLGNSDSEIATMVLFESESEQESFSGSFETLMRILTRSQNLFADEIFENGSTGNDRDATLEEVLHLVTDLGWDEAFPDIWGERKGSSVANAMDLARGGYFENVPAHYPADAWYTYDDDTSDYANPDHRVCLLGNNHPSRCSKLARTQPFKLHQ